MIDLAVFLWQADAVRAALLCALLLSVVIVATREHHGHLTLDTEPGVQKVHSAPAPRVGGLAVYVALLLAWGLVPAQHGREMLSVLLVAGTPALAFGLLEDLTKRVGIWPRLAATMASGGAACLMSGVSVTRLDVAGLDWFIGLAPVSVLFTVFAVGGMANAINIIDGFHGLASGTVIIALVALAAIADRVGDLQLAFVSVLVAAAVAGFWLVNYPWGRLFMGDGGAYFAGFALAWLAVLLTTRNANVSAWAALLVCAYPVIEVAYSVARRCIARRSPGVADSGHLHSLIKSRLVRPALAARGVRQGSGNAVVSPIVWAFTSVPAVLAIALFDRPALLGWSFIACALLYHLIYRHLAQRARAPSTSGVAESGPYRFGQERPVIPRERAG